MPATKTPRPETIEALQEFVAPARERISPETWDYLMGGGDTETTQQRNRVAMWGDRPSQSAGRTVPHR